VQSPLLSEKVENDQQQPVIVQQRSEVPESGATNITLSGAASLLETVRSSLAIKSWEDFASLLTGKLGGSPNGGVGNSLADKEKKRGLSMIARTAIAAVIVLVFLLSCCGCFAVFAGKFSEEEQEPRNGRHQYVSRNRIIYEWDQTPETITMYTKPPGGMSKQNIEVLVWDQQVQIGRKDKPPFLKEDLYAPIDTEASTWRVSQTGELEVNLTKKEAFEWPCVITAHLQKKSNTYTRR
jgi:hypothetical protein